MILHGFHRLPLLSVFQFSGGVDLLMWDKIWKSYTWINWIPKLLYSSKNRFHVCHGLWFWWYVWNVRGLDLHGGCFPVSGIPWLCWPQSRALASFSFCLEAWDAWCCQYHLKGLHLARLGRFSMISCQGWTGPNANRQPFLLEKPIWRQCDDSAFNGSQAHPAISVPGSAWTWLRLWQRMQVQTVIGGQCGWAEKKVGNFLRSFMRLENPQLQ